MNKLSEELKKELLEFVLNRTDVWLFNECIKQFNCQVLYSRFKKDLMREYKEVMPGNLYYSIIMCEVFRPYQCDLIKCSELRRKIDQLEIKVKLFPRLHPKRRELALEHDSLIDGYNQLLKPQNDLIKLYKKIQKRKLQPV